MLGGRSHRNLFQRDSEFLTTQLKDLMESLIPLDDEEFKLLANNPISKKIKKAGSTFSMGLLSTIYQEPLFAFAFKNYNNLDKALLLVESEKKQYKLLFQENFTKIFINNTEFGTITAEGKLYSVDGRRILSEIVKLPTVETKVIRSEGEDLVHLNEKIEGNTNNAERVFSLFHEFNNVVSDNIIVLTLYYVLLKPNLKL